MIPVCLNPDWLSLPPSIPAGFHVISPYSNCSACTWLCPLVCQSSQRWGLSWHNATLNLVPPPNPQLHTEYVPCCWFSEIRKPISCSIYPSALPSSHPPTHPPTHCAHIHSPTCSVHLPSFIPPAPTMYTALRRFKEGPWGSCLYSSGEEGETISFKKISFYQ